MQHVRSYAEGCARLASTPEGREILDCYVAIDDVASFIRTSTRISDDAVERVTQGLRTIGNGSDLVPYYLLSLALAELLDQDVLEVLDIDLQFKHGADLPVYSFANLTIH